MSTGRSGGRHPPLPNAFPCRYADNPSPSCMKTLLSASVSVWSATMCRFASTPGAASASSSATIFREHEGVLAAEVVQALGAVLLVQVQGDLAVRAGAEAVAAALEVGADAPVARVRP